MKLKCIKWTINCKLCAISLSIRNWKLSVSRWIGLQLLFCTFGSFCPSFVFWPLLLALQPDSFCFSKEHFGLKLFSFWDKPKGFSWKAKEKEKEQEQGRKNTEQWEDGNAINEDRCKITCPYRQRTYINKNYIFRFKLLQDRVDPTKIQTQAGLRNLQICLYKTESLKDRI